MPSWSTARARLEEGQNIRFEHRDAQEPAGAVPRRGGRARPRQGRRSSLPRRARLRAAKQATNTIPIVAIDLETDPIAAHFVQSLARPGGNVTGMFLDQPDLSGKHMELLKELRPKLARLAVLGDPEINASQFRATESAGRALSVQVEALGIQQADALAGAFGTAARNKAGALLLSRHPSGWRIADKSRISRSRTGCPRCSCTGLMSTPGG